MNKIIFFAFFLLSFSLSAKPALFKLFEKPKEDTHVYKRKDDPCPKGQHGVKIEKTLPVVNAKGEAVERKLKSAECESNDIGNVKEH